MENISVLARETKIIVFDQYGTVVDMQGCLTEAATPFLKDKGWKGETNKPNNVLLRNNGKTNIASLTFGLITN